MIILEKHPVSGYEPRHYRRKPDDVLTHTEQRRQRITFGDVQRHLAQLAGHPRDCGCGRCPLLSQVTAQRVYAIASGWQRQIRVAKVRGPCARPS